MTFDSFATLYFGVGVLVVGLWCRMWSKCSERGQRGGPGERLEVGRERGAEVERLRGG